MNLPLELRRENEPIEASFAAAFQHELESISSAISSFLGPWERAYLQTLQFPVRRNNYLLGRYAAKRALRSCLGLSNSSEVEIIKGVFEQPVVLCPGKISAEVSVAHSNGMAVAVACRAGHPIGVDLEFCQESNAEFLKSCLTMEEERLILHAGITTNNARYLVWTMKEALSKVLRCGLMTPLDVFELSMLTQSGPGTWIGHFQKFGQYKTHSWMINRYFLSVVLPKRTEIAFSPAALQAHLETQ